MKTRLDSSIAFLLFAIFLILIAAGSYYYIHTRDTNDSHKPSDIPQATKTPRQWMEETVECAALIATHESALHGTLDTKTENLVSYALGKAQEYALQAGINKSEAKTLYDQTTVMFFMAYTENPQQQIAANTQKADSCRKLLLQFEPGAQIQQSLQKAKQQLQPASATSTP